VDLEHAPRAAIKRLAIAGQRHAAPFPQEQGLPQPLLEPLDLHGDRRLGLENPPCCLGKAAAIGDRAEGLQLVEIERGGHAEGPSQTLIKRMKSIYLNNDIQVPMYHS